MKLIAFERADGGVSVAWPVPAHIFGLQACFAPEKINELQRLLIAMTPEEAATLERDLIPGKTVTIKTGDEAPGFKIEAQISAEDAVALHAKDLMQSGKYRRYVLIDESDLPPRETREQWRLDGDRLIDR